MGVEEYFISRVVLNGSRVEVPYDAVFARYNERSSKVTFLGPGISDGDNIGIRNMLHVKGSTHIENRDGKIYEYYDGEWGVVNRVRNWSSYLANGCKLH